MHGLHMHAVLAIFIIYETVNITYEQEEQDSLHLPEKYQHICKEDPLTLNPVICKSKLETALKPIISQHSGSVIVANNQTTCLSPILYDGQYYDNQKDICSVSFDNQLPCSQGALACHPVNGGGFVCRSSGQGTVSIKWSKPIECSHSKSCPADWECFRLELGKMDYRCEPPVSTLGLFHKRVHRSIQSIEEKEVIVENPESSGCLIHGKNICANGGDCQDNVCQCLQHFQGKYCQQEVNYCNDNACFHGIPCEPRLGGYNCQCPSMYAGVGCFITKRIIMSTMQNPNFIYVPRQSREKMFFFCFYTTNMGFLPHVWVDFGDGITLTASESDFKYYRNAREKLLDIFFPPLIISPEHVEVIIFNHTYSEAGKYTVVLQAMNRNIIAMKANYKVVVDPTVTCQLSVRLQNCAKKLEEYLTFTRQDRIVIRSDAQVGCSNTKVWFSWDIYTITPDDTTVNESKHYNLHFNVKTTEPNLIIPAYSLPIGFYIARLVVNMNEPIQANVSAITWFNIEKVPVKASVEGNVYMLFDINQPVVLNASSTTDKNLEPDKNTIFKFYWSCHVELLIVANVTNSNGDSEMIEKKDYCYENHIVTESSSVLVIPPKTLLLNSVYKFNVSLRGYENEDTATIFMVRCVPSEVNIIRIKCLKNCADEINPQEVTALQAICLNCNSINQLNEYRWTVTQIVSMGSNSTKQIIQDSDTIFGLSHNKLIINENLLKYASKYFVSFSGFEDEQSKWNSIGKKLTNIAVTFMLLVTAPNIPTGSCKVEPSKGYSLYTVFNISCTNLIDNEDTSLLTYNVAQFVNVTLQSTDAIWVSNGLTGDLTGLKLAAGLAENDHLTRIRVEIKSIAGVITFKEVNVTVFPYIYHLKSVEKTFDRLSCKIIGDKSELASYIAAHNGLEMVKLIQSVAHEIVFMNKNYLRYSEKAVANRIILLMRETMLQALSLLSIPDVYGLKQISTTLNLVVVLPSMNNTLYSNYFSFKIMDKIVTTLKSLSHVVSKADMLDIGQSILSVSEKLVQNRDKTTWTEKQNDVKNRDTKVEDSLDHPIKVKLIESTESKARFQSMTNILKNIFEYCHILAPFKVDEERTTLLTIPGASLVVERGSPGRLNENGIEVSGMGTVKPMFPAEFKKDFQTIYNIFIIIFNFNLFWWHPTMKATTFPFVNTQVFDMQGNKVLIPVKIRMLPFTKLESNLTVQGRLRIVPHWLFNDSDILVYQIKLPKYSKLFLKFRPIKGKMKVQVVVKKEQLPEIQDFWKDAITVPQLRPNTERNKRYIVYNDQEAEFNGQLFYIGIIPHVDTLRRLLNEDQSLTKFPDVISDKDSVLDDDYDDEFGETFLSAVRSEVKMDGGLPVEFDAQVAECYSLDSTDERRVMKCTVNQTNLYALSCMCNQLGTVTVVTKSVHIESMPSTKPYVAMKTGTSPVILFMIIFLAIGFAGIFLWSLITDSKDLSHYDAIILSDNDPTHNYTYMVIIETGRRPRAGTTSRVAIQLVGEDATSAGHVLMSSLRNVLQRGTCEWFVLKTSASLGNLVWINLWHDYTGADASWFCDKVIIQDIQTQEVWFFVAHQWLAPLHGDGTMSFSVDKTFDTAVFEKGFRSWEYVVQDIDEGLHACLSPFYKRPGDTYTRCQRTGVAVAHVAIIFAIVVEVIMVGSSNRDISMDLEDATIAGVAAFTPCLILQIIVRCVSPFPSWDISPLNKRTSLVFNFEKNPNDDDEELRKFPSAHEQARFKHTAKHGNVGPSKGKPMHGRRVEEEIFCFPYWMIYIIWILLLAIVVACISVAMYRGFVLSDPLAVHFIITFILTIFIALFLETIKTFVVAACRLMLVNKMEMYIEDRSDSIKLLENINDEKLSKNQRQEAVESMRTKPAYRPIPKQRVELLRKVAISEATARSALWDICIFLMFVVILHCIVYGTRDTLTSSHIKNIKNLIEGGRIYGGTTLSQVDSQEEFINYITTSFMENFYVETYNNQILDEQGQTIDLTNRLVGVPQLRQTRIPMGHCRSTISGQSNREPQCNVDHPGTKRDEESQVEIPSFQRHWKNQGSHNNESENLRDPILTEIVKLRSWNYRYDWSLGASPSYKDKPFHMDGGYVALLGRTKTTSIRALQYLVNKGWFDSHTEAIFLEFALYNSNRNLVSMVSVMGKREVSGGYCILRIVNTIKVQLEDQTSEVFVIVMLATLIFVVVLHTQRESDRIVHVHSIRYVSNGWYSLRIILALFGFVAVFLYIMLMIMARSTTRKLGYPDIEEFVNFYNLLSWEEYLIDVIAIMFFLVIFELWHILIIHFQFQILFSTLCLAWYSLLCYSLFFLLYLFAFVFSCFMLFSSTSYRYHTIFTSFITLVGFNHQHRFFESLNSSSRAYNLGLIYYILYVLSYMVIFRWGWMIILAYKYSKVKAFSRNVWLDPIMDKEMRRRLASLPTLYMKPMTQEYVHSLVATLKKAATKISATRYIAMQKIVQSMRQQPGVVKEVNLLSDAKSLSMASMVLDCIQDSLRKQQALRKHGNNSLIGRESEANLLLSTYLRAVLLEKKLGSLNNLITELVENENDGEE